MTALFCTQTMNKEVIIIIFLLSLLHVQSGKAKAVLKVQFSGLDLVRADSPDLFLVLPFLGGEGTRTLGIHLF